MVSAFHSPTILDKMLEPEDTSSSFAEHTKTQFPNKSSHTNLEALGNSNSRENSDMGETTEDEEVKINCIGGVQSYLTTSDEDEREDADDDSTSDISEDEDWGSEDGVVTFVSRRMISSKQLICPRPLLGAVAEVDEEDEECSRSSPMQAHAIDHDDAAEADDESSQGDGQDDMDGESDDEGSDIDEKSFDRLTVGNGDVNDQLVMTALLLETSRILEPPEGSIYDHDDASQIQNKHESFSASEPSVMVTPEMPSPCGVKRVMSPIDLDCIGNAKRMRWSPTSMTTFEKREATVSPSSLESETEMDKQLGEELREADVNSLRESTPVPLLSPPPSPLCVESDKGQMTTVCEWPCNLAVDSALTAIYCLQPPSPVSLTRLAEEEEGRLLQAGNYAGFGPLLPTISH